MADPSPPVDLSALARETRCNGRYPVPQTSPPRDEPFDVTYRCALPLGHVGPHGDGEVSWQSAALRVGEELSSVGPNGYYEMTPEQWLAWALAESARLRGELEHARSDREDYRARKDAAYEERNRLVSLLSRLWPSHRAQHPDDPTWEQDWLTIVCIHSPAGQLTWHVHDSQRHLFAHLPDGENHWDGHTTDDKYQRVASIGAEQAERDLAQARADVRRETLEEVANRAQFLGAHVLAAELRRLREVAGEDR